MRTQSRIGLGSCQDDETCSTTTGGNGLGLSWTLLGPCPAGYSSESHKIEICLLPPLPGWPSLLPRHSRRRRRRSSRHHIIIFPLSPSPFHPRPFKTPVPVHPFDSEVPPSPPLLSSYHMSSVPLFVLLPVLLSVIAAPSIARPLSVVRPK